MNKKNFSFTLAGSFLTTLALSLGLSPAQATTLVKFSCDRPQSIYGGTASGEFEWHDDDRVIGVIDAEVGVKNRPQTNIQLKNVCFDATLVKVKLNTKDSSPHRIIEVRPDEINEPSVRYMALDLDGGPLVFPRSSIIIKNGGRYFTYCKVDSMEKIAAPTVDGCPQ